MLGVSPLGTDSFSYSTNVVDLNFFSYYNGTTFSKKPLKIYDGFSWQLVPREKMYRWNNNSWELI